MLSSVFGLFLGVVGFCRLLVVYFGEGRVNWDVVCVWSILREDRLLVRHEKRSAPTSWLHIVFPSLHLFRCRL